MRRVRRFLDRVFRLETGARRSDAMAAARSQHGSDPWGMPGGAPPDWVKAYDEGRPKK